MKRLRQRGAALLILLTVLVALAASAGVSLLQRSARAEPARNAQARALALAAEALRGAAFVSRCQTPGLADTVLLPCPDTGGVEGESAASCPGLSRGWLPWRTLELPPLRDASGTCLWLERQGLTARIIAPGAAMPGQGRAPLVARPVCGGNNNPANYLDAADAALSVTLDIAAITGSCP